MQTKFIKWENWFIFIFLLLRQHGLKCLLKAGQLPLPLETRDKVVTAESRIWTDNKMEKNK